MRRFPLHKVPNIVPLAGILLSLLFSALSWGIGATNAIESVIFGLIGTVLSVHLKFSFAKSSITSLLSYLEAIGGCESPSRAS